MNKNRIVEQGGARVVVRRQTYGDRYSYHWLLRNFVPDLPEGADADAEQQHALRANFVFACAQAEGLEGAGFDLPVVGDTPETLEAKFQGFLALEAEFVDAWLNAVVESRSKPADPNMSASAS